MAERIEVLYEDEHVIIVNKAAGILSLPDRFKTDAPHLKSYLEPEYGELWTVHRLDRMTSGVMVLARNEKAHQKLNEQFTERKVNKSYIAIVHGTFHETEGQINAPIAEDIRKRGRYVIHPKGKAALTGWKLESAWNNFSQLSIKLFTGRTHQIRVHLSSIGHPIVADPLYSDADALYLSAIKRRGFQLNKSGEERPLLKRMALHAMFLEFEHPATGLSVNFTAPIPRDISAVIKQLSKWDN